MAGNKDDWWMETLKRSQVQRVNLRPCHTAISHRLHNILHWIRVTSTRWFSVSGSTETGEIFLLRLRASSCIFFTTSKNRSKRIRQTLSLYIYKFVIDLRMILDLSSFPSLFSFPIVYLLPFFFSLLFFLFLDSILLRRLLLLSRLLDERSERTTIFYRSSRKGDFYRNGENDGSICGRRGGFFFFFFFQ